MPYAETKVYFDGSHYIAIPHTTRINRKRHQQAEEMITIEDDTNMYQKGDKEVKEPVEDNEQKMMECKTKPETVTKKELFDKLYSENIYLNRREKKEIILTKMRQYFKSEKAAENFVQVNLERKLRNLICRRVRMCRKANLASFNYFCTFTYDNALHTEETFKKKLRTCFRHMCERKAWRYMGIWERAPKTNRLHFHGLFEIPEKKMPGKLIEVKDYDTVSRKMQVSYQSTYFNERFGRSDFKEINEDEKRLGAALAYILKYIEKTEERIVYSKGLPQYFISDIMEEDIVCGIGIEEKKLLLFDNFQCWDEGCLVGRVSKEVIAQLRKSN